MHSLIKCVYLCMFCRKSASCTCVSGLLHALVAMSPSFPSHSVMDPSTSEPEEEALPITSYVCQWKPPRKRKESTLQMSEATFHKPVYGREKRRSSKPLEEFAPRPPEYKNTTQGRLTEFLGKVHGKGLCVCPSYLTLHLSIGKMRHRLAVENHFHQSYLAKRNFRVVLKS